MILWIFTLLVGCAATHSTPTHSPTSVDLQTNRVGNGTVSAAICRDYDLARFMNNAMARYIHDMGSMSKYILDQIVAHRKPGTWMVHAEVISGQTQGKEWQTTTNGDIFSGQSMYGCFYHDTQTYILVARLY